jgi:hypothetical protein
VATDKEDVENVATPAALRAPVPSVVAPSRKVTVPVGIPEPGGAAATTAETVTACPNVDGFGIDATVVVVAAWLTVTPAPPPLAW